MRLPLPTIRATANPDEQINARLGYLHIRAAEGKSQPTVKGLAYSGGKMKQYWARYPIVIKLSGMTVPGEIPLLADHRNSTFGRVGVVTATVSASSVEVEGRITSASEVAQEIVAQGKDGWQMSVGADIEDQPELIAAGTRMEVNGQMHEGPFYLVSKTTLREVSVVAVGADANTHMNIAASFLLNGGTDMKFNMWLEKFGIKAAWLTPEQTVTIKAAFDAGKDPEQDLLEEIKAAQTDPKTPDAPPPTAPPVQATQPATNTPPTGHDIDSIVAQRLEAERKKDVERRKQIRAACNGRFPDIEAKAIDEGWSADQTREKVLSAFYADLPAADINISASRERSPSNASRVLEASLCLRAGIDEEAMLNGYGEETVEAAYKERGISFHQLLVECCRLEGKSIAGMSLSDDTIRAAFSTVSLPGILNNVANKRLLKAYTAQKIIATTLCTAGELSDFKESERYRLSDVGNLEPLAADGELVHGGVAEESATNQLDTYGKIFGLTRKMIYNDDLGAFLRIPQGMGARAARLIDQLFFTRLLANPASLFSAGNKNYKAGATTALSADSLQTAIQMFVDQVDIDGQPIAIDPRFLVVPTALKMTARELLNSTGFFSTGSSDKNRIPTYNALADEDLSVVTSPYLSNSAYTGNSALSWYLFGDPAVVDTFEIGYLKGRRTPTVERSTVDFDNLGMRFRVFYDIGVREQDHRGMVKFKGEA